MKRRRVASDPAEFPPFAEIALGPGLGRLTPRKLQRQFAVALDRLLCAAPALPYLEGLEVESSLQLRGNGLAVAVWLVPKKQRSIWAGEAQTDSKGDDVLRRDLRTLSESIRATQSRLDQLVEKLRKQRVSTEEDLATRRLCATMLENLSREEERYLASLRRHGGSSLDLWVPEVGEMRLAFPPYPGGETPWPSPARLRARIKDFNCGFARLFHLSILDAGEWAPLIGLEDGEIPLTWSASQPREELTPLIEAVRDGDHAEFTATLFEDATTRIPRRAELRGDVDARQVRQAETVRQRASDKPGVLQRGKPRARARRRAN